MGEAMFEVGVAFLGGVLQADFLRFDNFWLRQDSQIFLSFNSL
jgi:hypothetical protein